MLVIFCYTQPETSRHKKKIYVQYVRCTYCMQCLRSTKMESSLSMQTYNKRIPNKESSVNDGMENKIWNSEQMDTEIRTHAKPKNR